VFLPEIYATIVYRIRVGCTSVCAHSLLTSGGTTLQFLQCIVLYAYGKIILDVFLN